MAREKRTPEENARREKIRELLQMANIGSMDDIQSLFKETIAEFMENGLNAELDDELGYSRYDYKNKDTDNSRNGHSSKTLCTSFGDVEISVPRDRKGGIRASCAEEKPDQHQSGHRGEDPVHVRQGHDHVGYRDPYSGDLRRRGI